MKKANPYFYHVYTSRLSNSVLSIYGVASLPYAA